jgi:carbon-monoxide dehydrogenase medium subunit
MKARSFLYRRPDDLEGALALLADNVGEAQVLAGGQSLVPAMNMRLSSPGMVVDINRIVALRGVEGRGDAIRVGALVRHAEAAASPLIAESVPLLAMALPYVAHMAVRNRGTTCGSLALADPAAEMPAVAVALDAAIVLRRQGAERVVAARHFFNGLYQTARDEAEMIAEVLFPRATEAEVFGFAELSRRHGDFAIVGVAARARKEAGRLADIDAVVFGSEARPLLSETARSAAVEAGAPESTLRDIAHEIAREMEPMDNHQGRGETKRRQAAVLIARILDEMRRRAFDA